MIAPGRLRRVEREIRIGEEIGRVARVIRVERETETRPRRDAAARDGDGRPENIQHGGRHRIDAGRLARPVAGPGRDQHELVAAEPRHEIAGLDQPRQADCNLLEEDVARVVTEGIVHLLERIEIEKDESNLGRFPLRTRERRIEGHLEQGTVGQAGEDIVMGCIPDRLLGRLAGRDVDEAGDDAGAVADLDGIGRQQHVAMGPVDGSQRDLDVPHGPVPIERTLNAPAIGLIDEGPRAQRGKVSRTADAEEGPGGVVHVDEAAILRVGHDHRDRDRREEGLEKLAALEEVPVRAPLRLHGDPFEAPEPIRPDDDEEQCHVRHDGREAEADAGRGERRRQCIGREKQAGCPDADHDGPTEARRRDQEEDRREHQHDEQGDVRARGHQERDTDRGGGLPPQDEALKCRKIRGPRREPEADQRDHDDAEARRHRHGEMRVAEEAPVACQKQKVQDRREPEEQARMAKRLGQALGLESGFALRVQELAADGAE
ncbi:hypothetical protein AEGHOMDF_5736 [Methylobacterium soli]|nr:hypothetical protein AEGHOMDF_5736 [Methylobacterium soli]